MRPRFSKEQIAFMLHVLKSYRGDNDGLTDWERETIVKNLTQRLNGLTIGAKFHTDRFSKQFLMRFKGNGSTDV